MDFARDAKKLLEFQSISEEGNEELINFLIPRLENMNAKIILQQVPHAHADHTKHQYNLIAILGDDLVDSRTQKGFLLTSHVDTSAPGNLKDWSELSGNPFKPEIKNGKIFGLGAAKSKIDFLCKLLACEKFVGVNLKQPIYLAATCGGDSALLGSKYLIQSGAVNPKYVLMGHPTGLRIVNKQKAQITFNIRISFVAVERDAQDFNTKIYVSARTQSGDIALNGHREAALGKVFYILKRLSAEKLPAKLFSIEARSNLNKIADYATAGLVIPIKEMEDLKARFRVIFNERKGDIFELRFGGTGDQGIRLLPQETLTVLLRLVEECAQVQDELSMVADPSFSVPTSTISIGSIFQERDSIGLSLHLHLVPELATPEQRKNIEQDIKNRIQKISLENKKLSFDVRKSVNTPNYNIDENNNYIKILSAELQRAGVSPELAASDTSSEVAYFADKGFSAVAFGPGSNENNIHAANEFVSEMDVDIATRFYTQVIESFCVRGV